MTIPKITIDKGVKYVPKSEQTREIKQNTIKNKSTRRKQNRNTSQNNKKILKNLAIESFGILK